MEEAVKILIGLVKDLGIPGAFLVVVAYFGYCSGQFLKPLVNNWFNGQQDLMTALKANDAKHGELLEKLADQGNVGHITTHSKLEEQAKKLHEIHIEIKDIKAK